MEKLVKDEAIVLKKNYVGDVDLSVTVYSKKLGKESIYIPKGQLLKHPYVGLVEPLNWFKGVFSFKKDKIFIEEIDNHKLLALDIAKDLEKFKTAFYVLDTFSKYVGFPDERLFILLKRSIYYISINKDISLHKLSFLTKFINLYGIFPELDFCNICGEEINRKNFLGFLADYSNVLCKKCKHKEKNISFSLSFNDILVLKILKTLPFKSLNELKISETTNKKLVSFLESYLKKQIE